MIKWMFIRGVYFICKISPDIGNIIIASNFFFVKDGLAIHFYLVRSHRVVFLFVKLAVNCVPGLFNVPLYFLNSL